MTITNVVTVVGSKPVEGGNTYSGAEFRVSDQIGNCRMIFAFMIILTLFILYALVPCFYFRARYRLKYYDLEF